MRLRPVCMMMLAALLGAGAGQAAGETDLRPAAPPRKKNEIRIPIPGWSPEVSSNGCHVRRAPDELSPDRRAGRLEVPFWGLIDHAVGRDAVRATRRPEAFLKAIAALDDDLRRLTLLFTLWHGLGRDGL